MPVVAILSLGSPVVMDFVPHPKLESTDQTSENDTQDMIHDEPSPTEAKITSKYLPFSVVLMPRSLLLFKDMAYSGCYLFFRPFVIAYVNPLFAFKHINLMFSSRLFAWHKRFGGSLL